jgi:septal ring factor EnvC (AmiA/AmiB activator)
MNFRFWRKPKPVPTTEELLAQIAVAVAEMEQRAAEVERRLHKAVKNVASLQATIKEFKSQGAELFDNAPEAKRLVNQLNDETTWGTRNAMAFMDAYFKILFRLSEIQQAAHEQFPEPPEIKKRSVGNAARPPDRI